MKYHCEHQNWPLSGGLRSKAQDQQKFYAQMSSVAYGNTAAGRAEKLKKYKLNDWVQDDDLSTPDVAILYNPKTKEVVHSITGSRFRDPKHKWRDIRSDIGVALGTSRLGKRTKEVKNTVKKAKDKYKEYDHTLTGHSLGARVSQNVSKSLGIPSVSFNIGSSPLGVVTDKIAKMFGADHKDSQVIHYTTNSLKNKTVDPLSVSAAVAGDANETNVVKTKGSEHPHSISHFGAGKKKKSGAWQLHLSKVRSKNPAKSYKECLKLASGSYKK